MQCPIDLEWSRGLATVKNRIDITTNNNLFCWDKTKVALDVLLVTLDMFCDFCFLLCAPS